MNLHRMKIQEQLAGNRVSLHERIALSTPFSLQFSPSSYCNFKCCYCWQSLEDDLLKQKFKKQFLKYGLFKSAVDGCNAFKEPLQMILFAGLGEPMLHPEICKMIAYAKQSGVAKRVDLLTNASLLTKETSNLLVDAGLDRLRISIQGLTTEKYKNICGSDVSFEKIVDNISYFYSRRISTSIYIKIIDCALDENDESKFKSVFSSISDECAVEYLSPFVREIDFGKIQNGFRGTFRNGGVPGGSSACPLAFYMVAVQADGSVTPWCTGDIAMTYGNVAENSIPEIWHSKIVKDFWRTQLTDRSKNPVCAQCQVPLFNVRQGDCLNGHEQAILSRLELLDKSSF